VREPIESGAAILATHLLLAEFSERVTAIATLTIDPLMFAEPSERITAIATTIADMLLRARCRRGRHAPRLGLRLRRGRGNGLIRCGPIIQGLAGCRRRVDRQCERKDHRQSSYRLSRAHDLLQIFCAGPRRGSAAFAHLKREPSDERRCTVTFGAIARSLIE
jgi:hypothetical protein